MKAAVATVLLLLACAIGGCKPTVSDAGEPAASATTPAETPAPAAKTGKERLQEALASGRTGLWADPPTLCRGGARHRVTLSWNVRDAAPAGVVLWMDRSGKGSERAVKGGGAVGVYVTGPWTGGGSVFVLREKGTRRELGRLTIGGKPC